MRSLTRRGASWLLRRWRQADESADRLPEREAVLPVEELLGSLEARLCDGIVRRAGAASLAAGPKPGGLTGLNLFGRAVHEEVGTGPRGRVAVASGMALAGMRASVFLEGDELFSAHDAIRSAADARAPLVLHVANGDAGHAGYRAVASSGCFQALAATAQDALDLTLVARWLAERALVPGLIATDGESIQDVQLPAEDEIRDYLGDPKELVSSPTDAQRILFGNERSRLLRWFDPDRPVATGGARGSRERARVRSGSRLFFEAHIGKLAREAMDELSRRTGRPLGFVRGHDLDTAKVVLVSTGAAVEVARTVADHLRETRKWNVGVLDVIWLRPFPAREISRALSGRRAVAVIETASDPLAADAPLFREIEASVARSEGWISVVCEDSVPTPAQLIELCERLHAPERPRRILLDRPGIEGTRAITFPRREALLDDVTHAYPELRDRPPPAPVTMTPPDARSAALIGLESELPGDSLSRLAEQLGRVAGPRVHGTGTRPEPGVWEGRVWASPREFSAPGSRSRVSLLAVTTTRFDELGLPLERLAPGATLLVADRVEPGTLWSALPTGWRNTIDELGLRVLGVDPGLDAALRGIEGCIGGEESTLISAGMLRELGSRFRDVPGAADPALPAVVRRIRRVRPAHDSLPRFWAEIGQPRLSGGHEGLPDPVSTVGAVPAGASALQPAREQASLPSLDADSCSGCGRCWTACPESAIGATSLPTEALLTALSHQAGTSGPAADAVRRAHKHLASRLSKALVNGEDRTLSAATCRNAWSWVATRLELGDAEREAHDAAFEATLEAALALEPIVTGPFFSEPETEAKGSGELLVLAFEARACVGCDLCVRACPEGALESADRSGERLALVERRWRAWEQLPDTAATTLARAATHAELNPLAAILLSRHCSQAQLGGARGEPGSGERLAGRLVTALVEHGQQRRLSQLAERVEKQRLKVEAALHEGLATGLAGIESNALVEALSDMDASRSSLAQFGERLEAHGDSASFDRPAVLRLARLAQTLGELRSRLTEGVDGMGRSRFGIVVTRGTADTWAGRYPAHPYQAPLKVAPTEQGVELALGIAHGLVADQLELVRTLRSAACVVESGPDLKGRLEQLEGLSWKDLEPEERAACPPLLLLASDDSLREHGFDVLGRLLATDLPLKLVLLDGRGSLEPGPEPALVAMAHRRAFVAATSIAHPTHLSDCLERAIAWPGPALIHLHAPSPDRHGFSADATLERARLAVESRAHVLFVYDPSAEGIFGLRSSVEGNPEPESPFGEIDFATWAAGEERFSDYFEPVDDETGVSIADWLALAEPARRGKIPVVNSNGRRLAVGDAVIRAAKERSEIWEALRELSGAAGPFVDRMRAEIEQELAAEQQVKLEALERQHQVALSTTRSSAEHDAVGRLTQRLMKLAGYRGPGPTPRNGK